MKKGKKLSRENCRYATKIFHLEVVNEEEEACVREGGESRTFCGKDH